MLNYVMIMTYILVYAIINSSEIVEVLNTEPFIIYVVIPADVASGD